MFLVNQRILEECMKFYGEESGTGTRGIEYRHHLPDYLDRCQYLERECKQHLWHETERSISLLLSSWEARTEHDAFSTVFLHLIHTRCLAEIEPEDKNDATRFYAEAKMQTQSCILKLPGNIQLITFALLYGLCVFFSNKIISVETKTQILSQSLSHAMRWRGVLLEHKNPSKILIDHSTYLCRGILESWLEYSQRTTGNRSTK